MNRSPFGELPKRLTVRLRIAIAFGLAFVIVVPLISFTLVYLSRIENDIQIITEVDAEMGRKGYDLSLIMMDIRRHERNYRMFGNPAERDMVIDYITQASTVLARADSIILARLNYVTPEMIIQVRELKNNLEDYRRSFVNLTEYINESSSANGLQSEADVSRSMEGFLRNYRSILNKFDRSDREDRERLLTRANDYLDIFFSQWNGENGIPGDPSYVISNLEQSRQAFLNNSRLLSEFSWENMEIHKNSLLRTVSQATRNIVFLILVTALAGLLGIVFLPAYIVAPLVRLKKVFRKAAEGDFKPYTLSYPNDEVGDIAKSYNAMIERLLAFENLKTKKIAAQKRAFDRLIENISEPVCILNSRFKAMFYNAPFAKIFGTSLPSRISDEGVELAEIPSTQNFMDELKHHATSATNIFTFQTKTLEGISIHFKGRLVRNVVMEIESIVLVGKQNREEG